MYPSKLRDEINAERHCARKQHEDDLRGTDGCGFRPQHIERFRHLYRERFGVWLSETEAQRQLKSLIALVRYQQLNRLSPNQPETS